MQKSIILSLSLALCRVVPAQTPAPQPAASAPLVLTLQDAMARARANSPEILSANIDALLARQDALQAKAALLPTAIGYSQYIYTQGNHTLTGTYVSNDGVHVYNDQFQVHGDLYAPSKIADYHKAQLAAAVSQAKTEIAARGLIATVVADYYAMVSATRKYANAQQSLREAQTFLDITQKLERGGEAAHYDTVKAQSQVLDRQRDVQEAQLSIDKARLSFAVLLFPNFRQDFTVADDLDHSPELPVFDQIQAMASRNNPEIQAAQASVQQQQFELKSVRAEYLPSLSFDYFWGINANEFAVTDQIRAEQPGVDGAGAVEYPDLELGPHAEPREAVGAAHSAGAQRFDVDAAAVAGGSQRVLPRGAGGFGRDCDVAALAGTGRRSAAPDHAAVPGRRRIGAGSGGCADHGGGSAQRAGGRHGPLPFGGG